jgi:hypothetical protein
MEYASDVGGMPSWVTAELSHLQGRFDELVREASPTARMAQAEPIEAASTQIHEAQRLAQLIAVAQERPRMLASRRVKEVLADLRQALASLDLVRG